MVPPLQVDDPIQPFSVSEIVRVIKRSPLHRSPGPDFVTYEMLRHLSPKALRYLRHVFNSAFSIGFFPPAWKYGVVLALPKPGKPPLFPQNRRPIQLLSTLGKTFERLIYRRLFPFVVRNHISLTSSLALYLLVLPRISPSVLLNIFILVLMLISAPWRSSSMSKRRTIPPDILAFFTSSVLLTFPQFCRILSVPFCILGRFRSPNIVPCLRLVASKLGYRRVRFCLPPVIHHFYCGSSSGCSVPVGGLCCHFPFC